MAHLEEIARAEAAGVGLSHEQTLSYLRDNLHFYFHSRERRGMELFFELAAKMETLPAEQESARLMIANLLEKSVSGERLTPQEGLALLQSLPT